MRKSIYKQFTSPSSLTVLFVRDSECILRDRVKQDLHAERNEALGHSFRQHKTLKQII